MTKPYVLDANALIALIQAGPGFEKVRHILEEALEHRNRIYMSVLNWGEVFYSLWERRGEERAREVLANLSRLPIEVVALNLDQIMKAAEIKAVHKVPYADSVAAALAVDKKATLVTSDRDFERLGRHFPILWFARH